MKPTYLDATGTPTSKITFEHAHVGEEKISAPELAERRSLKFTINWVPPTLNVYSRLHWTKQRQLVETAGLLILAAAGSRVAEPEKGKVVVTIQFYRARKTDRDNCIPKVILDALVRLGFARNDSEEWMEQRILSTRVDRTRSRTEIEIYREDV